MKKAIIILFAFLFVNFFALPAMTAHHHENMPMSNCPFMIGQTALCAMNVQDHVTSWQTMFASLPVKFFGFVLFLMSFVVSWIWLRHLFDPPNSSLHERVQYEVERYGTTFQTLFCGTGINPRAP